MEFEKIIQSLFDKTANCDPDIIRTLDHAEHNIELDYRGRYILELLQNARDAAMFGGTLARVKIILQNDKLLIANNGAEFNEDGLRSICRIGLSSKTDISFIGHKGLGFKSILEITEKPEIVTKFGTVYFDRELAAKKLNNDTLTAKELPLLFLPMYKADVIMNYNDILDGEYNTLIILPFKKSIDPPRIREDLKQVKISSFPLLGFFDYLFITDEVDNNKRTSYNVSFPAKTVCEVSENNQSPFRLRLFEHKFKIKEEQFDALPEDERKLIDSETPLEIKIALSIDDKGRFKPIENASLYLFYPLEEKSGFRFIIHSYFVVTPNRKGLLESSPLNKILMDELVSYLTTIFLNEIKTEFPNQVQDILAFVYSAQNSLYKYGFYEKLLSAQKELPLIWSEKYKRHLQVSELYIVNEAQIKLFAEEMLGERILHKKEEGHVGTWMDKLLKANELTNTIIKNNINEYAEEQRKRGNTSFFQNLYLYAAKSQLYLTDKQILITESNELLSSDKEVYYGGQRTELKIPEELNNTITFLHDDIKIDKFRLIEEFIGAVEFKTEHLVKRILKLIKDKLDGRAAFIYILRDLKVESSLAKDILEGLLVPIINSDEWVTPLFTPVYFYSEEIKELYPNANFVDLNKLLEVDPDEQAWRYFLKGNNVWSNPAVFLKAVNKVNDEIHLKSLGVNAEIELKNDFLLDKPLQFSHRFQEMVLDSYLFYSNFILKVDNHSPLRGVSKQALDPLKYSSFAFLLQNESWLYPQNYSGQSCRPAEVLILPVTDEQQPQIKVLRKYYPIFFSTELQNELFKNCGAIHGRNLTSITAVKLFVWAANLHKNIPQETDFSSAWNRLYGFFFDFWRTKNDPDKAILLKQFKELSLLAVTLVEGRKKWEWKNAASILYIDDKPFYDYLPEDVKADLPPTFTKKDKNEIGIVLSKVGIVLSDRINKSLIPPSIKQEFNLFSHWPWVPFSLPIIEHELGSHIDESNLNILNKTTLQIVDNLNLEIQVQIDNGKRFIQSIPHYIEKSAENHYRVIFNNSGQNKNTISAIHELLETVLQMEFDIRLELQELSKATDDTKALEILNNLNIDVERANEINESFNSRSVSERLLFWNSFAQMFGIVSEEDESRIEDLFVKIFSFVPALNHDAIDEFENKINLNDAWTSSTLEILKELFKHTGKTIEQFNAYSQRKIDIGSSNRDKLYSLIQSRKKYFVKILHDILVNELPEKQSLFLDLIDQYSRLPDSIEYNSFSFDESEILNNHISEVLLKVVNSSPEVNIKDVGLSEVDLYNLQFELLVKAAKEKGLELNKLNLFLDEGKIKSVLCFDLENVIEMFLKSKFNTPESDEDVVSKTLANQVDVNDIPIGTHSPQQPKTPFKLRSGNGGFVGGSGKGNRNPQSQEILDEIGYNGEYYVYMKLSKNYKVEWTSKNAEKARVVVLGDDRLGYDMRYVNEHGNLVYVEVKATSGTSKQFNLTRFEVEVGIENKGSYHLYFVINALNKTSTQAENLGTIFNDFNSVVEFENSENFQVESNGYQINFS